MLIFKACDDSNRRCGALPKPWQIIALRDNGTEPKALRQRPHPLGEGLKPSQGFQG